MYFNLLGYCVVNLVKYKQDKEILKDQINKAEQDWLDLLLDASFMENAPRGVIPEVQHAYEVLERSTWSTEDLENYRKADEGKAVFMMGLERSREAGREEGREEGETIGLKKGREEGSQQRAIEIAKSMLKFKGS